MRIQKKNLTYIVYVLNGGRDFQYDTYEIPKRSGGTRQIAAPKGGLLTLQKRLNKILQTIYWERPAAHGFVSGRSIITNANQHAGKKLILNLDQEDFFPSINFGRVRGLFLSRPYSLNASVATIIAQIVCFKDALPQGAPTSPVISNMICSRLDGELQRLARSSRCMYTRYADDITFSTNLGQFSSKIYDYSNSELSESLKRIINENGFSINTRKIRLQKHNRRQEVTGLIVNEFVNVRRDYIRNVRAALHAWEKFGIKGAEDFYQKKYCLLPQHYVPGTFRNIIRGKIEFIQSVKKLNPDKASSNIPLRFLDHFHTNSLRDFDKPVIRTEGMTDWMHMVAALNWFQKNGRFRMLDIAFYKSKDKMLFGNQNLRMFCQKVKERRIRPFKNRVICIFDSDDKKISNLHNGHSDCIDWTGNVYSIVIPTPSSFKRPVDISIEFLHQDKTLATTIDGRRFYFSDEFNSDGFSKRDSSIHYDGPALSASNRKIIDSGVYKADGAFEKKSVALSKSRFARSIYLNGPEHQSVDFSGFEPLFVLLKKLLAAVSYSQILVTIADTMTSETTIKLAFRFFVGFKWSRADRQTFPGRSQGQSTSMSVTVDLAIQ